MQPRSANATSGRQWLEKTLLPLAIVCAIVGAGTAGYFIGSQYQCLPCDISFKLNGSKLRDKPSADSGDNDMPVVTDTINSLDMTEKCLQQLLNDKEKLSHIYNEIEKELKSMNLRSAICIPELRHVSLKVDNDPSTIVFPSCTRIKRCGGCCDSSVLSCQPTTIETRNFEVIVSTLSPVRGRKGVKGQNVSLEEHIACMCDCRIKKKDCKEKQRYDSGNCACICENTDEEERCRRNKDTKIWNPILCVCSCRKFEECNSGQYFDDKICRCRQIMFSRLLNRFASTKSSNYKYGFDNVRYPKICRNNPFGLTPEESTGIWNTSQNLNTAYAL